jgi:cobalt-zinc-cadmium resistance protein CzcA
MQHMLSVFPGIDLNFSQPIMDNVEEAVSGVKGSLCVKISGDSLAYTEKKAYEVYNVMKTFAGVEDPGVIRNIGQPELRIDPDQNKMALYGVTTVDTNATIAV